MPDKVNSEENKVDKLTLNKKSMFERAAILSAMLVLISFTIISIIYYQNQESKNIVQIFKNKTNQSSFSYLLLNNINKVHSQTSRG